MRHLRGGAVALLAAGALALSTAVSADPAIEITSPKNAATVVRTSGTVPVTGVARFDAPVDVTRRFYARRDTCGAAGGDNERLSVYPPVANEAGDGCGLLVAGLPTELFHALGDDETGYTLLTAVNGVPAVLDDGAVSGRLVFSGYRGTRSNPAAVHVGLARLEVQLLADGEPVGSTVVERTLMPTTPRVEYTFEFPVAEQYAGKRVSELTLRFRMRGVTALNGFLAVNGGVSYVDVPVRDTGSVLVSTDPGFTEATTLFPTSSATGTWTARLVLLPGEHTVYARAVQGDKVAEASTTFTVQ